MRVVVGTQVEVYNVGGADPDDEWSRDSSEGYVSNVIAREATDWERDKFRFSVDTWEGELDVNPGDKVFAVVADYETGDTFGRDGGNAQILDVFTSQEEAEGLAQAALNKNNTTTRYGGVEYGYSFAYNGKEYSRSWAGYFEHLQSLDVWEVVVGGGRKHGDSYGIKRGT